MFLTRRIAKLLAFYVADDPDKDTIPNLINFYILYLSDSA